MRQVRKLQTSKDAGVYRGRLEGKILVLEADIEACQWRIDTGRLVQRQAKRQAAIEVGCIEAGMYRVAGK